MGINILIFMEDMPWFPSVTAIRYMWRKWLASWIGSVFIRMRWGILYRMNWLCYWEKFPVIRNTTYSFAIVEPKRTKMRWSWPLSLQTGPKYWLWELRFTVGRVWRWRWRIIRPFKHPWTDVMRWLLLDWTIGRHWKASWRPVLMLLWLSKVYRESVVYKCLIPVSCSRCANFAPLQVLWWL